MRHDVHAGDPGGEPDLHERVGDPRAEDGRAVQRVEQLGVDLQPVAARDAVGRTVEHPEQREEDRRLQQQRKAGGQRVGVVLLVELHGLLRRASPGRARTSSAARAPWAAAAASGREDLICLTNSGISAIRITTVSETIDSAQVQPLSAPNTGVHTVWKSTRMPDTTQYSGCMIALPMVMNGSQMLSGTAAQASVHTSFVALRSRRHRSEAACRCPESAPLWQRSQRLIPHLFVEFRGSRYGVVPTRCPGVTAQQSADRQPAALDRAVHLDGAQRVRGAARVVAADVAVQRADHQPVRLEQADQQVFHRDTIAGEAAGAHCPGRRRGRYADRRPRRGAGKRSDHDPVPAGVSASRSAARCRSRRFTLLRTTALPTALETTKPDPDTAVSRANCPRARQRWSVPTAAPRDERSSGSRPSSASSPASATGGVGADGQADSAARPLRRRAAMMARPARVRIRRRKPWVRLRRRLLGWKVRLLTGGLPNLDDAGTPI